ncbi:MAG: hypothetical protein FWC36_03615 [Spirochaetes bacterium]|nr:hypothetical protein [Spirochaetota bacterium]
MRNKLFSIIFLLLLIFSTAGCVLLLEAFAESFAYSSEYAAPNALSISKYNVHVHYRESHGGRTGFEIFLVEARSRHEAESIGAHRFRLQYPTRDITRVRAVRLR